MRHAGANPPDHDSESERLIALGPDAQRDLGADNLAKLQQALSAFEPIHRLTPAAIPLRHDAAELGRFKNVCLRTKPGQLDCLGEVLGVGDFAAVPNQSVTMDLDGMPCRGMSRDAARCEVRAVAGSRARSGQATALDSRAA